MHPESQTVEADFRVMKESGDAATLQTIWINCRAAKFQYKEREAILVNVTDISHTKELERSLLLRNKMASLGRIASGMAHEIRNPLTGITSYLYTLEQLCELETLLPKDIALMGEIVGQLKLASHKVDTVIKRVLDFSRPTPPQMVRIDLNERLNNVLQLTAITLRKAGIKVTTNLSPSLPHCYGDVALLEQVFLNLVQNAAHAVEKSSAEKQIDIHSYALDNLVCAVISDSGPGVPASIKEKVFDPFFTTGSDGSGIGLSIAQRIITDHNGTLSLDDGPLGGARFSVSIPIEKRKLRR
jgi:signal transduction histidine kinase